MDMTLFVGKPFVFPISTRPTVDCTFCCETLSEPVTCFLNTRDGHFPVCNLVCHDALQAVWYPSGALPCVDGLPMKKIPTYPFCTFCADTLRDAHTVLATLADGVTYPVCSFRCLDRLMATWQLECLAVDMAENRSEPVPWRDALPVADSTPMDMLQASMDASGVPWDAPIEQNSPFLPSGTAKVPFSPLTLPLPGGQGKNGLNPSPRGKNAYSPLSPPLTSESLLHHTVVGMGLSVVSLLILIVSITAYWRLW